MSVSLLINSVAEAAEGDFLLDSGYSLNGTRVCALLSPLNTIPRPCSPQ